MLSIEEDAHCANINVEEDKEGDDNNEEGDDDDKNRNLTNSVKAKESSLKSLIPVKVYRIMIERDPRLLLPLVFEKLNLNKESMKMLEDDCLATENELLMMLSDGRKAKHIRELFIRCQALKENDNIEENNLEALIKFARKSEVFKGKYIVEIM
jgi:hypothetical protein